MHALTSCFSFPQTLMLLGCFAVFWTLYYMLEVFLTRHNVTFDLSACRRANACPRYADGRTARSLEDGTETETAPLYGGKGGEMDIETEQDTPSLGEEEVAKSHRGTGDAKAVRRERLADSSGAASGYLSTGLLTAEGEPQAC